MVGLFLDEWEVMLICFSGFGFSSYTEKFDKVMLHDVVMRVSDLPDAEVIAMLSAISSAISLVQIMYSR